MNSFYELRKIQRKLIQLEKMLKRVHSGMHKANTASELAKSGKDRLIPPNTRLS